MAERRSVRLSRGPRAPAEARAAIEEWLPDGIDRDTLEDVKLLVSELVTNAVRHPREEGPIDLALEFQGRQLRVEVSDPGGGFSKPQVGAPPPGALGGRGLLIVDRVASSWGVTPGTPTRVWFEL
jgi:sigma-B regulation protein RsbU (phosphoserine phosphatase)